MEEKEETLQNEFELLVVRCCSVLTTRAQTEIWKTSKEFELAVRQFFLEVKNTKFPVQPKRGDQEFPDICMGKFGVEVKHTLQDSWRCIGNSIQESQRNESVQYIYVVYGKMGGAPQVGWGEYSKCVIHVRTSHVPRFEVEIGQVHPSLFDEMGIDYDSFRKLPMHEKMSYIRLYARKKHPNERLWWIEDNHSLPIQPRLYTSLSKEQKNRLRAEAVLLCPSIVQSGRNRRKYDDVVFYLLTYHGVICHQVRDLFSAGSVANPKNDDSGGIYIQRAIALLENEMIEAARTMDDKLFVEYWGESVPPEKRISKWLERADSLAVGWIPSKELFRGTPRP